MPRNWNKVIVVGVIQETSNTRRFIVDVPDVLEFSYRPGQFVMFDLPIDDKPTTRSYSIASLVKGRNREEFCISLNPNGKGTEYFFNKVQLGTELKMSDAMGKFTLPEDPNNEIPKDVCFIATGAGIAPFRGMIFELLSKGFKGDVHLIFGNKFEKDILYYDEWKNWDNIFNNFHFHSCLSRETKEIEGVYKGHVHPIYKKIFSEKPQTKFFICGRSEMINEAKKNLIEMGFEKDKFHFENFG